MSEYQKVPPLSFVSAASNVREARYHEKYALSAARMSVCPDYNEGLARAFRRHARRDARRAAEAWRWAAFRLLGALLGDGNSTLASADERESARGAA